MTETSETTLPAPLTFQPFADIGDDDMKDIIADHARDTSSLPPKQEAAPGDEFSLAALKRKAEAAEKAAPPVDDEPEPPKAAEQEKVKPAAEAKSEITDETSDEDLAKMEENTKNLPKSVREHLKQVNYAARESKRAAKAALAEKERIAAEMAELKKSTPNSEATQAVQKKLEEAEAKLAEKEALLAGTNVRETEMFQKEIAVPKAELMDAFKRFAADYPDVPAEELIALTELRGKALDSKIEELTLDMPKRGVARLNDLVDRHAAIAEKESSVMRDAKASYDAFMARKRDEHTAALAKRAAERAEALPKVWEETIVKNAPFLKEIEGDADWNDRLKSTRDFVNAADAEWFNKQPTAVQVELTARAGAYPMLMHKLSKLQADNEKLRTRLGDRKSVIPGVGSDGTRGSAPVKAEEPPPGRWNPFAEVRSA